MGKFAWCIMMLFLWKPNETKHVGGASINYSLYSLIILSYSHGLKFVKLCLSENRLPNRLPHLLIFHVLYWTCWIYLVSVSTVSICIHHFPDTKSPARSPGIIMWRDPGWGHRDRNSRDPGSDHRIILLRHVLLKDLDGAGWEWMGCPESWFFSVFFYVFSRSLKGRLKENGDFLLEKTEVSCKHVLPLRDWGILRCTVDDVTRITDGWLVQPPITRVWSSLGLSS